MKKLLVSGYWDMSDYLNKYNLKGKRTNDIYYNNIISLFKRVIESNLNLLFYYGNCSIKVEDIYKNICDKYSEEKVKKLIKIKKINYENLPKYNEGKKVNKKCGFKFGGPQYNGSLIYLTPIWLSKVKLCKKGLKYYDDITYISWIDCINSKNNIDYIKNFCLDPSYIYTFRYKFNPKMMGGIILTSPVMIKILDKLFDKNLNNIIEEKKKCYDEEIVLGRVFQDYKELFKEIKMNHNS